MIPVRILIPRTKVKEFSFEFISPILVMPIINQKISSVEMFIVAQY
jgi:hypothetical protein